MATIASLGFSVDSRPVAQSVNDLDNLVEASGRAGDAIEDLGVTSSETARTVSETGNAASTASKSVGEFVRAIEEQGGATGSSSKQTKDYELAVKGATIAQTEAAVSAGKSSKGVADAAKAVDAASKSIDDYIKSLQTQVATQGLSAREAKLYELAIKGASEAQLLAADSAIKLHEAYEKGSATGEKVKSTLTKIGTAAAAGLVAPLCQDRCRVA